MNNETDYIEISSMVKAKIEKLFNKKVLNDNDNLYGKPYFLKAYNIMYVLLYCFKELNTISNTIDDSCIQNISFHSVKEITNFLIMFKAPIGL